MSNTNIGVKEYKTTGLDEKSNLKNLYFAHSMTTYYQPIEYDCISLIKKRFSENYEIVNPRDVFCTKINPKMKCYPQEFFSLVLSDLEKYFFPLIDGSEVFVFLSTANYLTYGVKEELRYAWRSKKPIYRITLRNGVLILTKAQRIAILRLLSEDAHTSTSTPTPTGGVVYGT